MKKRLVLTLMLIGLLAFGAGLGTYAWFTSSATSENNVFETGTLEIGVDDGDGNYEDTFEIASFENMLPGDKTEVKTLIIKNTGNVNLGYFRQFRMEGDEDLAKQLEIVTYTVKDWSGYFNLVKAVKNKEENDTYFDYDNDGIFTLYDIAKRSTEVSDNGWDVLGLRPNENQIIKIAFKLREDAGNDIQGKKVNLIYNLKATQINEAALRDNLKGDKFKVTFEWLENELIRQTTLEER